MIYEGVFELMSGCAPLTAIVGARITQATLPLNPTVPAITYSLISSRQVAVSMSKSFLTQESIEFSCWGNNYHDAAYAKAVLHSIFDLYSGTLPDGTVVLYTAATDNPDLFEQDSRLHRSIVTFSFTHR